MSGSAFIDGAENSTDSVEYLYVQTRTDGVWIEVYRDGRSLGIELGVDQIERLRRVLREPL